MTRDTTYSSQISRELSASDIVAPYYYTSARLRGTLNIGRTSDTLFRELVENWVTGARRPQHKFTRELQQRIAPAVGPARRGRPAELPRTWQLLDLPTDKDGLSLAASRLYYLMLHHLLRAVVRSVGDTEAPAETPDTPQQPSDGPDDDRSEPLVSQQELYTQVWAAIALELTLQPFSVGDGLLAQASETRRMLLGAHGEERAASGLLRHFEQRHRLSRETGIRFAASLVRLVLHSASPRWFTIEQDEFNTTAKLSASPALLCRIRRLSDLRRISMRHIPLIAPPLPWGERGIDQGGYHWQSLPFYKFPWHNRVTSAFLSVAQHATSVAPVLSATNAIQSTGWRINARVLDVVENILPVRAPGSLPPALAAVLADLHGRERFWFAWQADTRGRLYPVGGVLTPQGDDLARSLLEFADPKPLGTTGARCLAIHGSEQIGRSRLTADLKIDSESALTNEMRTAWVEGHRAEILASASNPLHHRWWQEIAKEPFRFLAFCFAWRDYCETGASTPCRLPVYVDGTCNGLQHVAAIMRDEALARATNVLPDSEPRDIYEEVSRSVRRRFEAARPKVATRDRRAGSQPRPTAADLRLARTFLQKFPTLLDRELAKSVVMIIPYGASADRYQAEIASVLIGRVLPPWPRSTRQPTRTPAQRWLEGNVSLKRWHPRLQRRKSPDAGRLDRWAISRWLRWVVAAYVAELFAQVLDERFPIIGEFTRSLRRAIAPALDRGVPVMWQSPSGLPVLQRAFRIISEDVDIKALPERLRFSLGRPTDEISANRQMRGILPNFIHSFDAAHLVMTINLAQAEGLRAFSTVHDAFATHACDIPTLHRCIRSAFIQLYPADVDYLRQFTAWCRLLAGARHSRSLALTPTEDALLLLAKGLRRRARRRSSSRKLQPRRVLPPADWLASVMDSTYFFA